MAFNLDRVLRACQAQLSIGYKTPHCYSAHVSGQGYVNRGDRMDTIGDYRAQLTRSVQSEIENMGFAPDYAEPGYDIPARGILFANWNVFPRNFDRVLERLGFAAEWSDEWTTCDDCNRAMRTCASGHDWRPQFDIHSDDYRCADCRADDTPDDDDKEI